MPELLFFYGCKMAQIVLQAKHFGLLFLFTGFCSFLLTDTNAQASWTGGKPDNAFVLGLAVDPASSTTVYAAIKGEHVAKTTNGGSSWHFLEESYTDRGAVAIDPQHPSTVYAGKGYAQVTNLALGLNRSMNGGESWASTGFLFWKEGLFECGISDILVKPGDSNTIFAAVAGIGDKFYPGGVYKSTDGGTTWLRTYPFWVSTLAVDPAHQNIMYFGTSHNGYVFQSIDGGSAWASMDTGWEAAFEVRDIEVDSNSQVYAATDKGLRKWNGSSWSKLSGLPTDQITALAIERSQSPETIYVGMIPKGVFVTSDRGNTFLPFNEGLGNLYVTKLAISEGQPKILYAGTALGGVWGFAQYEPGDINGDALVNLADAILALNVIAGMGAENVHDEGALIEGGKIGLQDVIYVLQKTAGLR